MCQEEKKPSNGLLLSLLSIPSILLGQEPKKLLIQAMNRLDKESRFLESNDRTLAPRTRQSLAIVREPWGVTYCPFNSSI